MMKNYLLLTLIFTTTFVFAQKPNKEFSHYSHTFSNKIFFDYFYDRSREDTSYQVTLYYQVPNYFYKFFKQDSIFLNEHEINIVIHVDSGDFVNEIYDRKKIKENDYQTTIQENYYYIEEERFHLAPGRYEILFKITDMKSDRKFSKKFKLKIPQSSDETNLLSSFLFTLKTQTGPDETALIPNISRIYHLSSDLLHIKYNIRLSSEEIKNETIQYTIYNTKDSSLQFQSRKKLSLLLKENFRNSTDSNLFTIHDSISLKDVKSQNNLLMIAYSEDDKTVTRQKNFWIMKSHGMMDMDYEKHIRLLSYIANSNEMDSLKAAKGEELKEITAIENFWKDRDPDPRTIENEERNFFYEKVEYANKNFKVGRYRAGWETDMGRVFIIYGPPDHIDKHDYNRSGKPYQIWYYNNLSKNFVFVDYTGFGEYELVPGTILDY